MEVTFARSPPSSPSSSTAEDFLGGEDEIVFPNRRIEGLVLGGTLFFVLCSWDFVLGGTLFFVLCSRDFVLGGTLVKGGHRVWVWVPPQIERRCGFGAEGTEALQVDAMVRKTDWKVFRRLLWGHNDTPFERQTPGRPIGRPEVGQWPPSGVFGVC
jgi:hypothetical protein